MSKDKELTAEEQVSKLAIENESLKTHVSELEEVIKTMEVEMESLSKKPSSKSASISHKGDNYSVIAKSFRLDKVDYKVEDLEKDAALVAKILSIKGQNILVKI